MPQDRGRARASLVERARIGCSGWSYEHWADGVFYPPGCPDRRWLAWYAERFDTVELNASFYRLPRHQSAGRWAEETPPGFTFAVKVSRYITHIRRLRDAGEHLSLLLERIEPLRRAGKLGPLLWQLPATFHRDDRALEAALAELPRDLRHAFEFRHESWFAPEVTALLREHGVALVHADGPKTRAFQIREQTAEFAYVRFHGGARGRDGNYSATELDEWADQVAAWARHGDVYAYFNNDWRGFAPTNALALKDRLRRMPEPLR